MIITAFPVGFFAGYFGIGGGLISVPVLFFIFETLGIEGNMFFFSKKTQRCCFKLSSICYFSKE